MRIEYLPASASRTAATRIVLLPGAYHAPADFITGGFVAAVRRRALPVDLLLVDPELVYLNDRSILQQLRDGIVLPARAAGCSSVWFTGISLGGFLALLYAEAFRADVDGLCLLAPYLGNRQITAEITRCGSLAQWQSQTAGLADELDEERRIWRFLHGREQHPRHLYLGYGRQDRFAGNLRLLAANLPAGAVDEVEGGHDWPAWLQLWNHFLERHAADLGSAPCT